MTIGEFLYAYQIPLTIGAQLVVSAAVSSLPPPTEASHPFYRWFYKCSNTLLANVSALRGKAQYDDIAKKDLTEADKENK